MREAVKLTARELAGGSGELPMRATGAALWDLVPQLTAPSPPHRAAAELSADLALPEPLELMRRAKIPS